MHWCFAVSNKEIFLKVICPAFLLSIYKLKIKVYLQRNKKKSIKTYSRFWTVAPLNFLGTSNVKHKLTLTHTYTCEHTLDFSFSLTFKRLLFGEVTTSIYKWYIKRKISVPLQCQLKTHHIIFTAEQSGADLLAVILLGIGDIHHTEEPHQLEGKESLYVISL